MLLTWFAYGPLATIIDRKRQAITPKGIVLTFDDGPDPRYTPQLLDLLDEFDIKAIFFCLGFKVQRHPELAHEIVKRGHQLGLHGSIHRNAWLSSPKQVEKNIRLGERQFIKRGLRPTLYRPPFGRVNLLEKDSSKTYWTKLFHDWDIRSEDRLLEDMIQASNRAGVWLLHDSTEGRAKPNMPLVMMQVLRRWLSWARQEEIIICNGRRWPNA